MGIEVKVLECFGFDILKSLPHRTQLLPVSIGLRTFASVLFSDTTGVSKADFFSVLLLSKCQHDIFLCFLCFLFLCFYVPPPPFNPCNCLISSFWVFSSCRVFANFFCNRVFAVVEFFSEVVNIVFRPIVHRFSPSLLDCSSISWTPWECRKVIFMISVWFALQRNKVKETTNKKISPLNVEVNIKKGWKSDWYSIFFDMDKCVFAPNNLTRTITQNIEMSFFGFFSKVLR